MRDPYKEWEDFNKAQQDLHDEITHLKQQNKLLVEGVTSALKAHSTNKAFQILIELMESLQGGTSNDN